MYIHQRVVEDDFASNVVVMNALIDMYAKYGSVEKAPKLFDKMHNVNKVLWKAMIIGYTQNNFSKKVLETFK